MCLFQTAKDKCWSILFINKA